MPKIGKGSNKKSTETRMTERERANTRQTARNKRYTHQERMRETSSDVKKHRDTERGKTVRAAVYSSAAAQSTGNIAEAYVSQQNDDTNLKAMQEMASGGVGTNTVRENNRQSNLYDNQ